MAVSTSSSDSPSFQEKDSSVDGRSRSDISSIRSSILHTSAASSAAWGSRAMRRRARAVARPCARRSWCSRIASIEVSAGHVADGRFAPAQARRTIRGLDCGATAAPAKRRRSGMAERGRVCCYQAAGPMILLSCCRRSRTSALVGVAADHRCDRGTAARRRNGERARRPGAHRVALGREAGL